MKNQLTPGQYPLGLILPSNAYHSLKNTHKKRDLLVDPSARAGKCIRRQYLPNTH